MKSNMKPFWSISLSILFALIWTSVTVMADWGIVDGIIRQRATHTYRPVLGIVISSTVVGSGRSSRSPVIRYQYQIDGVSYTSEQRRYGSDATSGPWASEVVAAHPPGATVTVYVHPSQPTEAVLVQGIEGSDLFHILFTLPFNVIMLGVWATGLAYLFRLLYGHRPMTERTFPSGHQICLPVKRDELVLVPLASLVLSALLSSAGIGFFFGGFNPSYEVAVAGLTVALAVPVLAFLAALVQWQRGRLDHVIDSVERTIQLPQRLLLREGETLRWEQLQTFRIVETRQGNQEILVRWFDGGGEERQRSVCEVGNPLEAEALVKYLSEHVDVKNG
jgi:hypothetical protein